MFNSLTNCFRAVARHAPPLRTALPLPATGLRRFSGAAIARSEPGARGYDEDLTDEVWKTVDMAPQEAALRAASPAFEKTIIYTQEKMELKPTSPGWYSREARIKQRRNFKKPWKLGPGAQESRASDAFFQLGINPLDESLNTKLLSHFVSDMGKIKSRAETGLTWKSQRRVSKAIRRAKMMGLMPLLSKRPLRDSRDSPNLPEKARGV